jgi:serine/threonine protein phosphatase PrpC
VLTYSGVFDGHGQKGTYCARFVRDNLSLNVQQALKLAVDKSEVSMHDAFVAGHQFTDKQMHCKKDRMSGTTAVCVMMQGTTVHVSNVGDSRAVLGHRDRSSNRLQACALTFDQTPYRKDERERCKKTGARVMNMDQLDGIVPVHDNWDVKLGEELDDGGDPPRIWHRTERYPGTAFTRSLGDQMAIPWGVIPDPG